MDKLNKTNLVFKFAAAYLLMMTACIFTLSELSLHFNWPIDTGFITMLSAFLPLCLGPTGMIVYKILFVHMPKQRKIAKYRKLY